MGPVNLGIKLYDGNSSHFCLCVLYVHSIYLPPFTLFCNNSLFLQKVNPSLYSKFVLSGDFNETVLNISATLYQYLHGILCSFNLSMVVQEQPRMASCGTACLIDQVQACYSSSSTVQLGPEWCGTVNQVEKCDS